MRNVYIYIYVHVVEVSCWTKYDAKLNRPYSLLLLLIPLIVLVFVV